MTPLLLAALVLTVQQPDSSVYKVSGRIDAPVTLGASLTVLAAYIYGDRWIHPRCPCDPSGVNRFDRPAIGNTSAVARHLSDGTAAVAIIAPFLVDALDVGAGKAFNEDAVVFVETLAINSALVTAAKYSVQRPLPRTYAGDPTLINRPEGYRSFYSGHTSTTFAALSALSMTLRLRHGEKTWPWIVTGVVGTSVAIERVADGRHFPSDVIVGAVMGTATGIAVPLLHSRRRSGRLSAMPQGGGMAIGWSIKF